MDKIKKEIQQEIKEEFSDEIKEVIYEQAKKEIKNKVKKKYYSIKDRILKMLGFGETQEQKIRRITNDIKEKEDPFMSDGFLGTIELYTVNYSKSILEFIGLEYPTETKYEDHE